MTQHECASIHIYMHLHLSNYKEKHHCQKSRLQFNLNYIRLFLFAVKNNLKNIISILKWWTSLLLSKTKVFGEISEILILLSVVIDWQQLAGWVPAGKLETRLCCSLQGFKCLLFLLLTKLIIFLIERLFVWSKKYQKNLYHSVLETSWCHQKMTH